jgi:GT2 family glycosyltransferase
MRAMQRPGLLAGRIEQTPVNARLPTVVEEFEMRWSLRQDDDVRRGVASASNLFVHRSVFEQAGTFREDMTAKSDWELCERARDTGFELVYCHEAVVRHRVIATWGELWRSKVRLAGAVAQLHRVRGRGKAGARREALRQLRPPLRSVWQVGRSEASTRRKLALAGTLAVSRLGYLAGWLMSEIRPG